MLGLINSIVSLSGAVDKYIRNGLVMANRFTLQGLNFPVQGSAEFNGTSDYIQTNEKFAFVNSAYSVSFWAYLNGSNTGSYPTPFQNGAYNSGGIQPFYFEGSDYIRMAHNIDGGNAVYGGTIGMAHDEWFFITFTFDGTSVRSYKNGSLQNNIALAAPSTNFFDAKIGGGVVDTYWNGNLANVAIWNRALSSDEINSVMWKSYDSLLASEKSGLQAWYRLQESELLAGDDTATLTTYAAANSLTFEGAQCVQDALNALPTADAGRVLFDAYDTRVIADSGSTEARTCTINELNAIL